MNHQSVIVYSLDEVDLSGIMLPIITVYDHPRDYPNHYVARVWDTNKATNIAMIDTNLKDLRSRKPINMVILGRHKEDDPVIIETWL